ncbi:MAG: hypothetical protein KAS99_01795 [Candidatus Omnitrophica bacterium]|nr:hypothetical protein [Candidatus Omnitrophota bacterium]
MKKIIYIIVIVISILAMFIVYQNIRRYMNENRVLKEVITRFQGDSRVAEVLVTKVQFDEKINKTLTTIKFLEYDTAGKPLKPEYFTFPGNIIQFQSLVIRFDDFYIRNKDLLRGKSVYLFWKVFMLDGPNTLEYEITKAYEIPQGYKTGNAKEPFEKKLWEKFWQYALNPKQAEKMGIKNVQIEAPGTMFVPGTLYTIKIEHDGGIRIDVSSLPAILRGEHIPD